jgi:hypothetical protein
MIKDVTVSLTVLMDPMNRADFKNQENFIKTYQLGGWNYGILSW